MGNFKKKNLYIMIISDIYIIKTRCAELKIPPV